EKVPIYQGMLLDMYPLVNSGAFENKGYEIEINLKKSLQKNLNISAGGFLTYAENKVINSEELSKGTDYTYPFRTEGYPHGQNFGYLVDYSNGNGFYNTDQELNSSNLEYSMGAPRVGDLIYQDLNDDGTIDEKDMAPIGSGAIPKYYYGFSGELKYKGFDINFLLQGVADWKLYSAGTGIWEYNMDGIFGTLHKQAWTEERYKNGEKITAPALSTERSTSHQNNDYYYYDRSYLRLKHLELGYTLPSNIAKAIFSDGLRINVSGHNLFTLNNMKSDDFGPEDHYHQIPVYRVYNIGLTINF
ncbi:MAG: SusC/RagA family TonB-linked outer membrane protein, partial [Atribacterota bacterium]|nr:SusC/RagA family TonB-linked outer membrane protein [Atribacterota bacterium]